tara:strand:+ start:982 stop:1200 length:219 start_codon:yes stop_codon:yes gene_type:complete
MPRKEAILFIIQSIENQNLKYVDLAKELKVSKSQVTKMLNNERELKISEINVVADFINVPNILLLRKLGVKV